MSNESAVSSIILATNLNSPKYNEQPYSTGALSSCLQGSTWLLARGLCLCVFQLQQQQQQRQRERQQQQQQQKKQPKQLRFFKILDQVGILVGIRSSI